MLFEDDPPPKLVGIARLAASSDLLEAKRQVEYLELETRRFIGRGSGRMRSIWTINPYRGCEYGCKYCYARYAHEFMELRDPELFERKIYAKQFQAAAFRAEVRRLKRGETIWIGTATDPYQPAERRFQITRHMLEVFADERGLRLRYHHQVRSCLAGRRADGRHRSKKQVRVHLTITTLDERLARLIEPRAPRPALRLSGGRELTEAGIPVSVLAHPVMPLINDSEESLDRVCAAAARNGAIFLQCRPSVLKPCSQQVFLPFLEQHFPHLVRRYRERFEKNAYLKGQYPEMIEERMQKIRDRHKLNRRKRPNGRSDDQLSLFQYLKGPGTRATLQRKVNCV